MKRKFDQMHPPRSRGPPVKEGPLVRRPLLRQAKKCQDKRSPEALGPASSNSHRRGGMTARKKQSLREVPKGLSLCQTYRVALATEQDYTETYQEVNQFACSWPDFSWDFPSTADSMLVGLFDDRAMDGVHAGWSGKVFSSIGYFRPEYSGVMRAMLPRAKAAQAGWKKLTPNRSRLPIPFKLAAALFHTLLTMGRLESGLIILLCFSLYLRPSEPHRLKCSQVIPPAKGVSGSRHVTIVLNPFEDGRASKTHEYDESLLVDSPLLPALGKALLKHARGRPLGDPLFKVQQEEVARDLRDASLRLRVPAALEVVMYKFRHGGASTDFALKHRPLAEVKLRGRWKSDASLRRYEKGGRLAEQLFRLGDPLRIHALRCARCVNAVLSGSASPLHAP